MRSIYAITLSLLLATLTVAAYAQTTMLPRVVTAAQLSTFSVTRPQAAFITDGANSSDCTVGLGTDDHWCFWNGSAWVADFLAGDVGIGTATPDTIAEVVGADPILTVRDTDTGLATADSRLRIAETGAADALDNYWDIKAGVDSSSANFSFHVLENTTARLTISGGTGDVGIGTAVPASHLSLGDADGSHSLGFDAPATVTTNQTCTLENDAHFIPDSCVGDGTDDGGAPTTVNYLVGTADVGLSAEIVVGTAPGGQLGGTWAAPTVDAVHSGSAHHTVFTPNANPAIDHSSYVAGHSDGANCTGSLQYALGVDAAGVAQCSTTGLATADNRIPKTHGAVGIQGSGIAIDDSNNVTGMNNLTMAVLTASGASDINNRLDVNDLAWDLTPRTGAGYTATACYVNTAAPNRFIGTCTSSRRFKRRIRTTSVGLDEVMQLRSVDYTWRGKDGLPDLGLIAEEVAEIHPLFAQYAEDGEPISLNQNALIAALVRSVQELSAKIEQLEMED